MAFRLLTWSAIPVFASVLIASASIAGQRPVLASPVELWRATATASTSVESRGIEPVRRFRVRLDLLRLELADAPPEGGPGPGVEFVLPMPDGRLEHFRAFDSPILAPELARRHPELRTWSAIGLGRPSLHARLDLSPLGLHAVVLSPEGIVLIDPLGAGADGAVVSRWSTDEPAAGIDCEAVTRAAGSVPVSPGVTQAGAQLRTLRFILAATGEWTQALGGIPPAMATMLAQVNTLNAVFERDVALRLQVVELVPFPDPATDPYAWTFFSDLLDRSTVVLDSLYGSSNYDAGEVLTKISGTLTRGLSYTPSLCSDDRAGSVVASSTPGSFEEVLTMAHELGHTIGGASHTQDRACNRSTLTPYEVGSGVTIVSSMPAACPVDFQPQRDPYYHAASIEQILTTLAAQSSCGTSTATGNSPPVANAGPDRTIPRATPFVLTGTGSDPDPGDTLTYTWEEFDKSTTASDPVSGPLLRWRPPTTSAVRVCPALPTVWAGTADPYEQLPGTDRLLHFRLLVRDNHAGTGGLAWDDMVIAVNGAPFVLASPNGGESLQGGVPFPVTWTVGGGSVAASVNILLTTDGGASWTSLATGVPNTGVDTVRYVTAETRPNCRIKVEAADNIFFDVSNADFSVAGSPVGVPAPSTPVALVLRPLTANPFRESAAVSFGLPGEAIVDLAVFSVAGGRIRTLASGSWSAGDHPVVWDGEDAEGRRVPPGLYFMRLAAGGEQRTRSLVRLR